METLPHRSGTRERPTGLICPDCGGVLAVTTEGSKGFLHFRCRVGHALALDCLVAAKERQLEEALWTSLMRLEELAELMVDARAIGNRSAAQWVDAELRIERLRAEGRTVREILERNHPIDLGIAVAPEEGA